MNTKTLLLSLFSASILMSSCNLGNDNEDNYQTGTYTCANLVIPANGESFATKASYNMTYYFLSGTAALSTSNLSLGYSTVSFMSSQMPCETRLYNVDGKTKDVTTFSGGMANDNGVVIQNIKGFTSSIVNLVDDNLPLMPGFPFIGRIPLVVTYTANYDYTVKTFMPDAVYTGTTTIMTQGSENAPFNNSGILYRVAFSEDLKKANVFVYNGRFAENMPVTMNFMLKDLEVEYTRNGYIISGKDLIPMIPEGNDYTDYGQAYVFNNFELINSSEDLTVSTVMYTVQIGKAKYNGSFTGHYVLSGSNNPGGASN